MTQKLLAEGRRLIRQLIQLHIFIHYLDQPKISRLFLFDIPLCIQGPVLACPVTRTFAVIAHGLLACHREMLSLWNVTGGGSVLDLGRGDMAD